MDELRLLLEILERSRPVVPHEQAHRLPPAITYKDGDLTIKRAACGCIAAEIRQLAPGMVAGRMRQQAANN